MLRSIEIKPWFLDLFFTNISPPLFSLCWRRRWVTEVHEPSNCGRAYLGDGSARAPIVRGADLGELGEFTVARPSVASVPRPPTDFHPACFSDVSPPTLISLPLPSPRCHQMLRPPSKRSLRHCAPRTVILLLTISAFRCECSNTAALMDEPRFSRIESLGLPVQVPSLSERGGVPWVTEADDRNCIPG